MNLFTQPRPDEPPCTHYIEIVEPGPDDCSDPLPPEGNVKLRNYRLLNDKLRAYTPTGDVNTSPTKGKLVSKFDVCSAISPPRAKILELLRPEDPNREALEAIVRPAPRRGLARPLDEDTKRFLQRALLSPSPQGLSAAPTPEPFFEKRECSDSDLRVPEELPFTSTPKSQDSCGERSLGERSLADELREAEEDERAGVNVKREIFRELRRGAREAVERERLGRLALSVEEEDSEDSESEGLSAAARRLDALLAESRDLHEELAGIQQDMQAQSARAYRCVADARALVDESRALRYLDDVVALLKGDVAKAVRARAWPFALGRRRPDRNYVI